MVDDPNPRGMFAHLGETFVVLRLLRGLSQAELAEKAGIRSNQVSRYETGQVLPQLAQLERILTALDVGLPELLFAMSHLERTAKMLRGSDRLPEASLVHDSIAAYWRDVTDLQLRISRQVTRVLEAEMRVPPCRDPRAPRNPEGSPHAGS